MTRPALVELVCSWCGLRARCVVGHDGGQRVAICSACAHTAAGERLTKEREAAIRRDVEAAVQRERGFPQAVEMAVLCGHFEALLAEIDALRAAPPTTYLHADGTEEPIGELVERLTRERDEALRWLSVQHDAASGGHMHTLAKHEHACTVDAINGWRFRAEKAEARVRELEAERDGARAQLARLRDLVQRRCDDAVPQWAPELRAALAEIEKGAGR